MILKPARQSTNQQLSQNPWIVITAAGFASYSSRSWARGQVKGLRFSRTWWKARRLMACSMNLQPGEDSSSTSFTRRRISCKTLWQSYFSDPTNMLRTRTSINRRCSSGRSSSTTGLSISSIISTPSSTVCMPPFHRITSLFLLAAIARRWTYMQKRENKILL